MTDFKTVATSSRQETLRREVAEDTHLNSSSMHDSCSRPGGGGRGGASWHVKSPSWLRKASQSLKEEDVAIHYNEVKTN